jgi:hypothetical protein
MTDLRIRPPNGGKWRDHLTRDERRELVAIEKEMDRAAVPLQIARRKRLILQNRASVRMIRAFRGEK